MAPLSTQLWATAASARPSCWLFGWRGLLALHRRPELGSAYAARRVGPSPKLRGLAQQAWAGTRRIRFQLVRAQRNNE